jgi:hypothetical protein
VAEEIGAQMLGKKSNECIWNGERTLIKSAHSNTTSVGVLYHMTGRIDSVLGAFQEESGSYRVMRLPIERCLPAMTARPTASHGPSAGRVGLISRKIFEDEGQLIKIVQIAEPVIGTD